MVKYHIADDGEPRRCGALRGKCPYGDERHGEFTSLADARAFAEEQLKNGFDVFHKSSSQATALNSDFQLIVQSIGEQRELWKELSASSLVWFREKTAVFPRFEELPLTDALTGFKRLAKLMEGPRSAFDEPVTRLYDELERLQSEGVISGFSGGHEKSVYEWQREPRWLLKFPSFQKPDHGVISLANEANAYLFDGKYFPPTALPTKLFWLESGIPFTIQEKLETTTANTQDIDWVPKHMRSYAQIGRRFNGQWVKYDYDVGESAFNLLCEEPEDEIKQLNERWFYLYPSFG